MRSNLLIEWDIVKRRFSVELNVNQDLEIPLALENVSQVLINAYV